MSDEVKTAARGRVESWDPETGWGALTAPELPSGVFAHFSEGEGYRDVAERIVPLDD